MWAYVIDSDFLQFTITRNLPNCPETFQLYLKEVGTSDLQMKKPIRPWYEKVPPGSCIRLRTPEEYVRVVTTMMPREKPDKSRRSSSCCVM